MLLPPFVGPGAVVGLGITDDDVYIGVDRAMRVRGVERMYAVGDCVNFNGPKMGHMAVRQAEVAAANITLEIEGVQPLSVYDHEAMLVIDEGGEGELLRRIDPQHRSLGQFFQDEIATPLSLDFYIRLPESIPDWRLAHLVDPSLTEMLFGFPIQLMPSVWNSRSNIRRALEGFELAHDAQHIYPRNLEIPADGGVGTARAIARAYSVFATGGKELGLSPETLEQLAAPAIPTTHGFYDECMKTEVEFSLGFMKANPGYRFANPGSFGMPGAGGSLGFADPLAQIGYGYIPNRKSVALAGDPRDVAIRDALYSATPAAA